MLGITLEDDGLRAVPLVTILLAAAAAVSRARWQHDHIPVLVFSTRAKRLSQTSPPSTADCHPIQEQGSARHASTWTPSSPPIKPLHFYITLVLDSLPP